MGLLVTETWWPSWDTRLSKQASNVSFLSYFMLGDLDKCLQILLDSNRIPEAAFFARTYLPSEISRIVEMWKEQLSKVNEKAGQSLADPKDYPNLFLDFNSSLEAQQMLARERSKVIPAAHFLDILPNHERKPLDEMNAVDEEDMIDQQVDAKDHPISGSSQPGSSNEGTADSKKSVDDLEAELEADLDDLKLDDIDTTDVNLDDEELLED